MPSGYFHELANWSSINRLYNARTLRELQEVRREAARPALVERLIRVVSEQRGHTLAMQAEEGEDRALRRRRNRGRPRLAGAAAGGPHRWSGAGAPPGDLARRIAARVEICLKQAGLGIKDIDAVFMTGGSTRLPHVHSAIVAAAPGARVVDGDTFGSVGTGLAIEAGPALRPLN